MTRTEMKHIEVGFKKTLHEKIWDLRQTSPLNGQFILYFCYIVSRAGTDISAALAELDSFQVHKPVILVVFHHTFDPEKVIPDSNAALNREQILAVDCLFYENEILQCQKNKDAVDKMEKYIRSQNLTRYACLKEHDEYHSTENCPLICSEEHPQCCGVCSYRCRGVQNCCSIL